jgi:hypothetical protein
MKRFFLALLLFAAWLKGYSQHIEYYTNYDSALSKAKQANKLLFVTIGTPHMVHDSSDVQRYKSGLNEPEVAAFYSKKFINLKLDIADSAYAIFRRRFPVKINTYPAYLFLDKEGNLVYKGVSVITSATKNYMDMAHNALEAISSHKTISYYEKLDKQEKLDAAGIKIYITLKQSLGLNDNADLIDKYVNTLSIASLDNYNEVLFILKAGPLAYGKAYNLAYTNRKIIDSIYKHEPLTVKQEIHRNVSENTRKEAIKTKNVALANRLSNFVRNAWSSNYRAAAQWSSWEMLNYYHQVKDTTNYYNQAGYYYDNYYMRITPDSINKLKEKAMEAGRKASMERVKQLNPGARFSTGKTDTSNLKNRVVTTFVSAGPAVNDVSSTLNNVAYTFYSLGTRNPIHLTKALLWCKRAITLSPDVHAYYDTMAHILYRLNFYDEALLNQTKAIELAKKQTRIQPLYVQQLQKELTKMQEHSL